MNRLVYLALVPVAFGSWYVGRSHHSPEEQARPRIVSQGPTVERLEKLSDLVTSRVYIADVLTGDDGYYHGAWLIKGDAIMGVDLSHAHIADKNDETKAATVVLPQPRIIQSRVDHQRSRTWEVKRKAWTPWGGNESNLRDNVMLEAQNLVANAAQAPDNVAHARANADAAIKNFYHEIGWDVVVIWTPMAETAATPATGE